MGLVETGVGIVPGLGRLQGDAAALAADHQRPGGPMPPLMQGLRDDQPRQGRELGCRAKRLLFLRPNDGITMNRDRLLADAKAKALALADGYRRPMPPADLACPARPRRWRSSWPSMPSPGGQGHAARSGRGRRTGRGDLGRGRRHHRARWPKTICSRWSAIVHAPDPAPASSPGSSTCSRPASRCATDARPTEPRLRDMRFVLHELLGAEGPPALPGYEEATPELVDSGARGGREVRRERAGAVQPLRRRGGLQLREWRRAHARGFRGAYGNFARAAGPASPRPGMGRPGPAASCSTWRSTEMFCQRQPRLRHLSRASATAPTMRWRSTPTSELQRDLPAQARRRHLVGHDVPDRAAMRHRPRPDPHQGRARRRTAATAIGGTKIFISAGEHDLTENIIHLVLAGCPTRPPGTRGISLFLVPKFLPVEARWLAPGARNGVRCARHRAQDGHPRPRPPAPCSSTRLPAGWSATPHQGMAAMFTMMNAARLGVGMQGLAVAEAAYQAPPPMPGSGCRAARLPAPKRRIACRPDHRPSRRRRHAARPSRLSPKGRGRWPIGSACSSTGPSATPILRSARRPPISSALMTPIIKAYLTDHGFAATNLAMQLFGGHGYIRETGHGAACPRRPDHPDL